MPPCSRKTRSPSVPLILYAVSTETSITRLFLAGMVPADQLPAAAYRDGGGGGESADALLTLPR